MKMKLFKGLSEDSKAEFKANFIQASPFRKRLREVLDIEIQSVYNEMELDEGYDCPNWSSKQAGKIEKVKTLKMIKSWLENEEK